MPKTANAYIEGWNACMRGEDGRYTNPYAPPKEPVFHDKHAAWSCGFLDAMDAEDGEQPDPHALGLE